MNTINLFKQLIMPFLNSNINTNLKTEFYVVALDFCIKHGMMKFVTNIQSIQTIYAYEVLRYSITNGCTNVVRLFLLDPRIDRLSILNCNAAVKKAYFANHIDTVKILMEDKRITLYTYDIIQIVKNACISGHKEIMKILLENCKHYDYKFNENVALGLACKYGHIEIVELLLKISNINPWEKNNYAIKQACANGHVEIVKILIKLINFYNSKILSDGVYEACKNNRIEVLKTLLEHKHTKPSAENNIALYIAAVHKYRDIVELLLKDRRTNRCSWWTLDAIILAPKIVQHHTRPQFRHYNNGSYQSINK